MLPERLENPKKGFWVVLEGADGCGKSTQAAFLTTTLQREGFTVIQTAEPTHRPMGKYVREHGPSLSIQEQLFCFSVDRYLHLAEHVLPALKEGHIVVQDRYWLTTTVFQSLGLVDISGPLFCLQSLVWPDPDLTLYLDADIEVLHKRLAARGRDNWVTGRLEEIAASYNKWWSKLPEAISICSDSSEPEELAAVILNAVKREMEALERDGRWISR